MEILYFEQSKTIRQNVEALRNGATSLTTGELADIKLYLQRYKDYLEHTEFFQGKIKDYRVVSCFAEKFHVELLDYMINKRDADISFIVILSDKKVLFKKSKNCSIDLCNLAKILCDGECVGNEVDIAYGELNNTAINFTKILTPC